MTAPRYYRSSGSCLAAAAAIALAWCSIVAAGISAWRHYAA